MNEEETATLEVGDRSAYAEGDLLYQAMLADLQEAAHSIRLESYIFASDAVGAEFFVALCAAAMRGVSVALRADHAGLSSRSPTQTSGVCETTVLISTGADARGLDAR